MTSALGSLMTVLPLAAGQLMDSSAVLNLRGRGLDDAGIEEVISQVEQDKV